MFYLISSCRVEQAGCRCSWRPLKQLVKTGTAAQGKSARLSHAADKKEQAAGWRPRRERGAASDVCRQNLGAHEV